MEANKYLLALIMVFLYFPEIMPEKISEIFIKIPRMKVLGMREFWGSDQKFSAECGCVCMCEHHENCNSVNLKGAECIKSKFDRRMFPADSLRNIFDQNLTIANDASEWEYYERKTANHLRLESEIKRLERLPSVHINDTINLISQFLQVLIPSKPLSAISVGDIEFITISMEKILHFDTLKGAEEDVLNTFIVSFTNVSSQLIQPQFSEYWEKSERNPLQPGSAGILNIVESLGDYSSKRYLEIDKSSFIARSEFLSYWMVKNNEVQNIQHNKGLIINEEDIGKLYFHQPKTSVEYLSLKSDDKLENETNLPVTVYIPNMALKNKSMLVNVRYSQLNKHVPIRHCNTKEDTKRIIHSTEMNSEIVTTSIHPLPSTSLFQQNPVHITFHHKSLVCGKVIGNDRTYSNVEKCKQLQNKWENINPEIEERSVCVFWQSDTKAFEGGAWSDSGCTLVKSNLTHTTCQCTHLTSFAVLLQVSEIKIADEVTYGSHMKVLDIITDIGCSLSLVGVILMCSVFTKLKFHSENMKIHFNLGVAVGLADLIFLVERIKKFSYGSCIVITILIYYTNMCVLAWMLIEAIHLYSQVVVVFISIRRWMKYFIAAGWAAPILLILVSASGLHWKLATSKICWLSPSDGSIWAFAAPAIFVLIFNTIILLAVVKVIISINSGQSNSTNTKKIKNAVRGSIFLFPLLGTTWLFGLLAISESTIVFQYLFASINSMQGFFLFVFHCLCNTEVREGAKRLKWFTIATESNLKAQSVSTSSLSPWCSRKYSNIISSKNTAKKSECSTPEEIQNSLYSLKASRALITSSVVALKDCKAKKANTVRITKLSKIMPLSTSQTFDTRHKETKSVFSSSSPQKMKYKLENTSAIKNYSNKSKSFILPGLIFDHLENTSKSKSQINQITHSKKQTKNPMNKISESEEKNIRMSYDSGLNSIENESILDEDDATWMACNNIVLNANKP